jgi:NAD(P)-dependent dehydrogenase (short-subunit alcohol dehydrogenase family)
MTLSAIVWPAPNTLETAMTKPTTDQQTIVITGVTRGLGRVLAEGFAVLGHSVAGCGRSGKAIEELQTTLGQPHNFTVLDVTADADVKAWATDVLSRLGPPDLLLNNAAIINRSATLWELSAEEFDPVVDINIKGAVNVIRHFVPAMIDRGSGVIVNFSSEWGRSTSPEVAPYCATKWAIEGLTRALAQELPRGLAAIPLNPGIIDTDMLRTCFGADAGRYPSPAEWVKTAIPFLLGLGPQHSGKPLSIS